MSEFGGPAWTKDEATGQYYYHAYLAQQPDLNWRNPDVHTAMMAALRFWLDRGVDGFRLDTIHHLFEDEQLRDNPPNPYFRAGMAPTLRSTGSISSTSRRCTMCCAISAASPTPTPSAC